MTQSSELKSEPGIQLVPDPLPMVSTQQEQRTKKQRCFAGKHRC
jgi:hypothetical protein